METGIYEIVSKRLQTTMIGALSEFEKSFSYLWGSDKDEKEPLTEKEERFFDLWEDTRNRILNNGNNQLRKAVSEIKKLENRPPVKYTYKYNRREE